MGCEKEAVAVGGCAAGAEWTSGGGVVAADGSLRVVCRRPGDWSFALERSACPESGVSEYTLALSHDGCAEPPAFCIEVRSPKTDMQYCWTPVFGCNGRIPLPQWARWFAVQRSLPIIHRFNGGSRNRLTLAVGESRRDLETEDGIDETDISVTDRVKFFCGVKDPCARYEVALRIDRRDVFWSDAVKAAAEWLAERSGATGPMTPPECAYRPFYSTWYNHHHEVSSEKIERELSIAADIGMEGAILDAGWHWDGEASGLAVAGDWEAAKGKFPDMAGHVRRVHGLGMKYMMWIALPYVGFGSKACVRFADKILYRDEAIGTACLDPRFPDVRGHLASTCERAMREWGLDGLKLDFIDQIEVRDRPDPAVADGFAGRDARTVAEGVELLMAEVARRVRGVKRDALVEFRSAYFGPVMRGVGNIVRVADCPGQLAANRVGIVDLRIVCPGTCVHSDMIAWPVEASAEEAARYVLSSIFGTVQYSVALDGLDQRKTAMLRHWIAFSKRHLGALQKGTLRAFRPEFDYPVVEGSDGGESVVLVSSADFAADVPASTTVFVLNNTGAGTLLLRSPVPRTAVVRDTLGAKAGMVSISAGVTEAAVPQSGYLEFSNV